MLKALIFDVDGTLAETEELHRASFNKVFAYFNLNWHWDVETYGKLLTTTGGKERIARYASEIGYQSPDAALVQKMHSLKNDYYAKAVCDGGLVLRPGIKKTIRKAHRRGIKLGIATTTSRSNLTALLRSCFSEAEHTAFNAIICGEDVLRKKPDPEVFLQCLAELSVRPNEAMVIEDSVIGLAAAKAADLRALITPSVYTLNDNFVGAAAVLPDLSGGFESVLLHWADE